MAIPVATTTFQSASPACSEFCALDSWLRDCSVAMLPIPIAIAMWARHQRVGLLNWIHLPTWAAVIATFLLMDYAYWWWHWAMHMVPFFWRFHNVHHTDLDMDVSTAARFHFGEMILSTGFLSLAVVLFGIGPIMLVVFFATFEAATLFHHSNWRLPIHVERVLNLILVTPRMHGIHHSIVQRETNSNWVRFFVGGTSCIAQCGETCRRMPSRSVSLHTARKTN